MALADITNGYLGDQLTYTYSAYGKNYTLDISGDLLSAVGSLNSILFKGYMYDRDLEMYYCGSRWYDPVICRFINGDTKISGINNSIKGYNLFSYCFNNPINMSDPEGNWPQWIKNTVKWVTKNVVKPVVKTVKNTLSKFDATFSKGSNISFAIINFSFNIQGGISIDTKGNVAIQHSTGIGSSTESLTFSATTYKSVTNAPNIEKLEGNAYQIGGSVGVPVSNIPLSAGADLSIIPDYE